MATSMLQQLTTRLHQLALQGTKSNGTIQICTRYLQTSSVCQRSLDTRRLPIYRFPSNKKGRWEPRKKFTEMYEYTVEPLPFPRTGGRGPNGRIWNHRRGGGDKKVFRMIAWARGGSADAKNPEVEVVSEVRSDQNRTGNIAMVATGERKRWILATENMKPGDVLKNSMHLAETPVRGKEGDTYPLGSLPVGSLVNCVEQFPGHGGFYARAAGTSAMLLKKVGDKCIVRLPSKREVQVSAMCQATLGRVSNIDHNKQIKGKAGVNRWLGIRPRSGRWHRKTGRQGRKIRPIKPMLTCDKPRQPKNERIYTKPIDGVRLLPRLLPGDFQI